MSKTPLTMPHASLDPDRFIAWLHRHSPRARSTCEKYASAVRQMLPHATSGPALALFVDRVPSRHLRNTYRAAWKQFLTYARTQLDLETLPAIPAARRGRPVGVLARREVKRPALERTVLLAFLSQRLGWGARVLTHTPLGNLQRERVGWVFMPESTKRKPAALHAVDVHVVTALLRLTYGDEKPNKLLPITVWRKNESADVPVTPMAEITVHKLIGQGYSAATQLGHESIGEAARAACERLVGVRRGWAHFDPITLQVDSFAEDAVEEERGASRLDAGESDSPNETPG